MTRCSDDRGLRTFEQVLVEELEAPEFRAEWTRLALARAVALRLVRYRGEHNLTQTALGRLVGMSQPAIARLEDADQDPSQEALFRLADALAIEFAEGDNSRERSDIDRRGSTRGS